MILNSLFNVFFAVEYQFKYLHLYKQVRKNFVRMCKTLDDGKTILKEFNRKGNLPPILVIRRFLDLMQGENHFKYDPINAPDQLYLLFNDYSKFVEMYSDFLADYDVDEWIDDNIKDQIETDMSAILNDYYEEPLYYDYSIIDRQINDLLYCNQIEEEEEI